MKLRKCKQLVAIAALFGASAASQAALIHTGVIEDKGTGFGNVNTVLTLQNNNGNNPKDPDNGKTSGAIFRLGGVDAASGNILPNAKNVHNSTYSFGELNITSAGQLVIVFNAIEPGETDKNAITLESLMFSIYTDAGGTALFNTSLANSIFFPVTETGTGKSGFTFMLDAGSIADAQQYITAGNRFGLSASLSGATGGNDTFYVRVEEEDEGEGPGNEIPEPGSIALLGLGVAGMTALRRRTRKA